MFDPKDIKQAQIDLEKLTHLVKWSGDLLNESIDPASTYESLRLLTKVVDKLAGGHDLYDRNASFHWDAVDVQEEWLRFFMAQHDIFDVDEATSHPEWSGLDEHQLEWTFLKLNDHDRANSGVRDGMYEVFEGGFNDYEIGDEVYWKDPDNDECSKYGIVKSVTVSSDPIYTIKGHDGSEFEAFEHELK